MFNKQLGVPALIDTAYSFFVSILIALSIIVANYGREDYSQTFFSQLQKISSKSNFYPKHFFDRVYRKLLYYFTIINTIGLFIVVVEITSHCLMSDYEFDLAYFNDYLAFILLLLIFLQILYKVEFLLYCFRNLNSKFANLLTINVSHNEGHQMYVPAHVSELCKIHRQLSNLIQMINDTHGWQITLLFCTTALTSLNNVYFGVVDTLSEGGGIRKAHNVVGNGLLMAKGVFIVLFQCVRTFDIIYFYIR